VVIVIGTIIYIAYIFTFSLDLATKYTLALYKPINKFILFIFNLKNFYLYLSSLAINFLTLMTKKDSNVELSNLNDDNEVVINHKKPIPTDVPIDTPARNINNRETMSPTTASMLHALNEVVEEKEPDPVAPVDTPTQARVASHRHRILARTEEEIARDEELEELRLQEVKHKREQQLEKTNSVRSSLEALTDEEYGLLMDNLSNDNGAIFDREVAVRNKFFEELNVKCESRFNEVKTKLLDEGIDLETAESRAHRQADNLFDTERLKSKFCWKGHFDVNDVDRYIKMSRRSDSPTNSSDDEDLISMEDISPKPKPTSTPATEVSAAEMEIDKRDSDVVETKPLSFVDILQAKSAYAASSTATTWNSAAASTTFTHSDKLKEVEEIKIKTQRGVEIILPKLLQLSQLSPWIRKISEVRANLESIVTSKESVHEYLNFMTLISKEAKLDISALLCQGKDINDIPSSDLYNKLALYAKHQQATTPIGLMEVVSGIRSRLQPYFTRDQYLWNSSYSHSGRVVNTITSTTCEQWISTAYLAVYKTIQEVKYETTVRIKAQLFIGQLEPAEFRQYLVVQTNEAIGRNEEVNPISGDPPIVVSWNDMDSIVQFALQVGREVDTQSRRQPTYFSNLGKSSEHKLTFSLLDSSIRDLAKPIRLATSDNNGGKNWNNKRSHSDSKFNGSSPPKKAKVTPAQSSNSNGGKEIKTGCAICGSADHKQRQCTRCYTGCSQTPSASHNPFKCEHNPYLKDKPVSNKTSNASTSKPGGNKGKDGRRPHFARKQSGKEKKKEE
jgi:hypothetical protein